MDQCPLKNKSDSACRLYSCRQYILVAVLASLLAFIPRAWRLEEIQYQFDDWLGAFHPGPPVSISDGPSAVLWQIHKTSQYYMASTMTITYNTICQVIKLFTGHNFTAMRWWFAAAFALGVGLAGLIAARLYGSCSAPTWATILMGSFSITSIVFSQFANNFSFTPILTAGQLWIYLFSVRGKWRWPGFLLLAVVAYFAQMVMYTQFLVTAGILIAAALEITFSRASWKRYFAWLFSGLTYCFLSFLHFYATFLIIPRDEPFREYMHRYYPVYLLGRGGMGTAWDGTWAGYYLARLYDFLNYHWSLVFNPGIYLPLRWNWVSLPFLVILFAAVVSWVRRKIRQSAVNSEQSELIRQRLPLTAHCSMLTGTGIPLVLVATIFCHLLANRFLLITFGGTRQTVYLAVLMWLGYGEAVRAVLYFPRWRSRGLRRAVAGCLVALTVVPFALSLPGFYRDRVTRIDLDRFISAIEEYRPDRILAGRDSIQAAQLTMMSDPRFSDVHWPGHPYESEVLDLDLVADRPQVAFTLNGREYRMEWVERENFPRDGENMLYLDTFIASDARYEGPELLTFYHPLVTMISPDQRIIPLVEKPGNAPDAVHQSIYWPPNAFYLYLVLKDQVR